MSPRISLDARLAGYPGIGRFIIGLWGGLLRARTDMVVFTGSRATESWLRQAELQHPSTPRTIRARPYRPAEQVVLPRLLRKLDIDVHHSPHVVVPYLWRGPVVLSVHDLFLFKDPTKARSAASGAYHRIVMPRAVSRASIVVAGCTWAAQELRDTLGVADDKLRVVDYGIDHAHFRPRSDVEVEAVRRRHALPDSYLLYVGTAKPHKNLKTLLRAHRATAALPDLVVAGASTEEITATDPSALDGRVMVLGRVPDDDLPALYSGAAALLLPSLYESLGFSAVEAMACGTPVIASSGGGLPDTVGDAGMLVEPTDVDGWRHAMSQMTDDVAVRATLVERGRERVKDRDWSTAARSYLAIYDEALR